MSRFSPKISHIDSGLKSRDSSKSSSSRSRQPLAERAHLSHYRVIQRELVYVIGIPIDIANEELLNKYEYFGQYGQIKKIVVNNTTYHASSYQQKPTVSAYITFQNIEDAWECIYALENFSINGHLLKASFGTSKYCSSFLSGQKCTKPDCMYLHYMGEPKDSFNTEEIQHSDRFLDLTRPSRPNDYYNYKFADKKPTIFPPRRILTAKISPSTASNSPEQGQSHSSSNSTTASGNSATAKGNKQINNENDKKSTESASGKNSPVQNKNSFVSSLFSPTIKGTTPLKVNYSIDYSLYDQLSLSRKSIREFLDSCHKDK
ncbi:hypothetical protein TRFO_39421 [Tritrichomonas foetus]|uniref:RRM domain-containing protein n=1 Tax=Tritrichomonas foetus TaxID=1144522 RepID=A0A1J4J823_9EUKA|nr:hypothetical protein TRFO_39421 [Tritrichomonas foetus]|eukprot:OHS94391.1 hypothetical protein TRFO_39421 [Tritrichomonas foetus]